MKSLKRQTALCSATEARESIDASVAIEPADPARLLLFEHCLICGTVIMEHPVFKFDRNPEKSAAEPKRPLIGIADRRTGVPSTIESRCRTMRRPRTGNI